MMFKIKSCLAWTFIIFISCLFGFSQDQPRSDGESTIFQDKLLDHLVGVWELTGVVAGDSVENTLEVKWVLNHQFLQLHYKDVHVPSEYEALVHIGFNHKDKRYVVHWLDIFGGRYSETLGFGKLENNSIKFVFKSPDSLLHNIFTWFPDQQKWTSIIEQQDKEGKWQTFAVQEIRKTSDRKEQALTPQEEVMFTRDQLIEDIRQLADQLESAHPDPYINGGGKIAFHRRLHRIIEAIPAEGLSVSEFYSLLKPFVAAIQDAHTSINTPSSSVNSSLGLPIGFETVENHIYAARVYSEGHRPFLGALLSSVEGVPFAELVDRQKRLRSFDNEYGNLNNLISSLNQWKGLEDLIPECKGKDRVAIIFQMPNGNFQETSIFFIDKVPPMRITPPTKIQLPDFDKSDPVFGFLDAEKKIAILRFGNMMAYREAMEYLASVMDSRTSARWANHYYERFNNKKPPADLNETIAGIPAATETFRSLVSEMKKSHTETLLIDVRGNSGGNSFITDILMYFLFGWKAKNSLCVTMTISKYSDLFFTNYKERKIENINKNYTFPLRISDYAFPEFMSEEQEDQEYLERYVTFASEKKRGVYEAYYQPNNIIVITSSRTFSSAYWLAADLTKAGALLVGTPTGQAGNCFGDILSFTLKNSGLACGVSYRQFLKFPDDPEKGRLLRPDFELTYEKLKEYDFDPNAEILYALETLLKRGKRKKI